MSNNVNANSNSESTASSAASTVPVTSAQSSVSAVTSTASSRPSQSSAISHAETSHASQSPKSTTYPVTTTTDPTSSSQRPSSTSTSSSGYSSHKNRKLVPRSRSDNEDRQNKATSTSVGIQQNQVLGSGTPPGNNTYVIRDNEGRWFLLQTNAAPGSSVHQANGQHFQHHQLQQLSSQLIKSNLINGNATLGQLARSLAPKPPTTGTPVSSNPSTSLLGNSSPANVAHSGSILSSAHSNTAAVSSTQQQQAVVGHYQTLRSAANANPQLLTMINGYYVHPAQPSPINNQSVTGSSSLRLHPVTSVTSNTVKSSHVQNVNGQSNEKWTNGKNSDDKSNGNASPNSNNNVPVNSNLQNFHAPSALTSSTNSNKSYNSSKASLCSKAKVNGSSLQNHGVTSGCAPVAVMPNGSPVQSNLVNGSSAPLNFSSGQNIRQQLIAGSNIHGQLLPVFQQQQNLPRFASQPATAHNSGHGATFRRRAEGDVEFGVENKPPSIECHGESKEAHKVRLLFLREAQAFREKLGPQSEIVHSVDGLEILESDTPFPPMPPVPLEEWMPRGPRDMNRSKCQNQCADNFVDSDASYLGSDSRHDEELLTSTPQTFSESSNTFETSPDKSSDSKKKRKRKTNEVDRLLQMDFGPNEGRLRDIIENSDKSVEKKIDAKGQKIICDSVSELSASPNSSGIEGRGYVDEEDEKPSSSNNAKERKRRGRIANKKNCAEVEEKGVVSKSLELDEEGEKQPKILNEKTPQREITSKALPVENIGKTKLSKSSHAPESANVTETSLNSSAESTGDLGAGVGNISLSDEDLDTERCIYCDGYLRVKRLISHPQYCSKKCRKLWKKNPLLNGGGRSSETSIQQLPDNKSNSATTTPPSTVQTAVNSSFSLNRSAPVSPNPQQRSGMTLILKRNTLTSPEPPHSTALCQNQDDQTVNPTDIQQRVALHNPTPTRVYIPTPTFVVGQPHVPELQQVGISHAQTVHPVHSPPGYSQALLAHPLPRAYGPRDRPEYPESHPRTWTCDEVAAWVTRVTGTDTIGEKFRNQDVDGQSLLLMAESEGGIAALLTQKLLLKLGPVLKLEKALKDLIAKSNG